MNQLGGNNMTMVHNRHLEAGLTDDQVLEMYEQMLLARRIDERIEQEKFRLLYHVRDKKRHKWAQPLHLIGKKIICFPIIGIWELC